MSGLNNDMAMHLVDVDYLVDQSRPTPQSVINGYPLGPHSLVATVVSVLGTQPLWGWLGLLVAVPVLTGITALGGLRDLPGGRRLLAAVLVAFAYLAASVLGIAGFKELIAGMFLVAFALGLREIEREPEGRIAVVAGLTLITAAMIPVYSLPGVAWLVVTAALWVFVRLLQIRAERGTEGVREVVRASMRVVIPAAVLFALVGLAQLPKIIDFLQSGSIGNVADTDSKLRFVVSPLETLGIWPSGNWLLGTHDVTHFWIFGAIGLAGLIIGLVWWIGRVDYAVPTAVISGLVIWLATKYIENGGLYILAKAVVVPASVVMLLVVTALLSPGGGWPKRIFAVAFIALAGYSTFLALRDTVIAPHDRLQEMGEFQGKVAGQRVLALTGDRFTDYGLRSAEVSSPAFNAEIRVDSVGSKSQRLPIDFDSVPTSVLNQFPYAVTTSAIYQSQAPPGWTLADSTESYRLWKRTAKTPPIQQLAEEARPGRIFRCKKPKFRNYVNEGGEALTWQPRTVIAKRLYWKAGSATGALGEGGVAAAKRAPDRQQPRARGDRQPADRSAGRAMGPIASVRQPRDGSNRQGPRPRRASPGWRRRGNPVSAGSGPVLAGRDHHEQGRPRQRQRDRGRRQLVPVADRSRRPRGDRQSDGGQSGRLQAAADGGRVRPVRGSPDWRPDSETRPGSGQGNIQGQVAAPLDWRA